MLHSRFARPVMIAIVAYFCKISANGFSKNYLSEPQHSIDLSIDTGKATLLDVIEGQTWQDGKTCAVDYFKAELEVILRTLAQARQESSHCHNTRLKRLWSNLRMASRHDCSSVCCKVFSKSFREARGSTSKTFRFFVVKQLKHSNKPEVQ